MASEFQSFSRLPVEIQIKIWQFACDVPRVIELGGTPKKLMYRGRAIEDVSIWQRIKVTSLSPRATLVPAVLETCVISREVALKVYRHSQKSKEGCVWFNSAVDVVYFGKDWHHTDGWDHWRDIARKNSKIRHFAFHMPAFAHSHYLNVIEMTALEREVEGVTLVAETLSHFMGANTAPAPRFKEIANCELYTNKTLRCSVGGLLKAAQSAIITEAWCWNDLSHREDHIYVDGSSWSRRWVVPKVKFMIEDEQQARKERQDREERRIRNERAVYDRDKAEFEAKMAAFDLLLASLGTESTWPPPPHLYDSYPWEEILV